MRCVALLLGLLLAACTARPTIPVAISQPGDAALSCDEIAVEITRNEAEATRLMGADADVVSENIAIGVASAVFFWPALGALDLSDAEQIRFRALSDRNANLARMREARKCGTEVESPIGQDNGALE